MFSPLITILQDVIGGVPVLVVVIVVVHALWGAKIHVQAHVKVVEVVVALALIVAQLHAEGDAVVEICKIN